MGTKKSYINLLKEAISELDPALIIHEFVQESDISPEIMAVLSDTINYLQTTIPETDG